MIFPGNNHLHLLELNFSKLLVVQVNLDVINILLCKAVVSRCIDGTV